MATNTKVEHEKFISWACNNGAWNFERGHNVNGADTYTNPATQLAWRLWQETILKCNVWERTVDEALVSAHLGVTCDEDTYETAKKKLNDLICWNIKLDRFMAEVIAWYDKDSNELYFENVDCKLQALILRDGE
jgi:hypothetical protein